jgi:hypothetical protein
MNERPRTRNILPGLTPFSKRDLKWLRGLRELRKVRKQRRKVKASTPRKKKQRVLTAKEKMVLELLPLEMRKEMGL